MSEGPIKTIINVQYNIPRFIIAEPGKQNRACTGDMRITPGIWEPLEFQYMNADGVPINLSDFNLLLLFWYPQTQYELLPANMETNKVLLKQIYVDQVYKGVGYTTLSDQDTLTLNATGRSVLRWSIYISDISDGTMFLAQITQNGERWGNCYIDPRELPTMDDILGTAITP